MKVIFLSSFIQCTFLHWWLGH